MNKNFFGCKIQDFLKQKNVWFFFVNLCLIDAGKLAKIEKFVFAELNIFHVN